MNSQLWNTWSQSNRFQSAVVTISITAHKHHIKPYKNNPATCSFLLCQDLFDQCVFSLSQILQMECRLCHEIPMERGHKQKGRNIASLMEVLQGASLVCFLILLPDLHSYVCLTCHKRDYLLYTRNLHVLWALQFLCQISLELVNIISILMQLLPPNLAYKFTSPVLIIHWWASFAEPFLIALHSSSKDIPTFLSFASS